MNCYKEQGHPLSTEQNEMLDALKQDWSESLDILKHRSEEYKNWQVEIVSIDVLDTLLRDLTKFQNERRGVGENVMEDTIASYPISAKHNPFYNQSFNGGTARG